MQRAAVAFHGALEFALCSHRVVGAGVGVCLLFVLYFSSGSKQFLLLQAVCNATAMAFRLLDA